MGENYLLTGDEVFKEKKLIFINKRKTFVVVINFLYAEKSRHWKPEALLRLRS